MAEVPARLGSQEGGDQGQYDNVEELSPVDFHSVAVIGSATPDPPAPAAPASAAAAAPRCLFVVL